MRRNVKRASRVKRRFECLEQRNLLAAEPMITEFLAANQSAMVDPGGKTPDWIEVYNAGDQAINLAGWYLTDDASVLTQMAVPRSCRYESGGRAILSRPRFGRRSHRCRRTRAYKFQALRRWRLSGPRIA